MAVASACLGQRACCARKVPKESISMFGLMREYFRAGMCTDDWLMLNCVPQQVCCMTGCWHTLSCLQRLPGQTELSYAVQAAVETLASCLASLVFSASLFLLSVLVALHHSPPLSAVSSPVVQHRGESLLSPQLQGPLWDASSGLQPLCRNIPMTTKQHAQMCTLVLCH